MSSLMPKGWNSLKLKFLGSISSGEAPPVDKNAFEGEYQVWGANGFIGFSSQCNLLYPALIIGRVGASGAVNIAKRPLWISDNALVFIPKHGALDIDYGFYALKSLRLERLVTQSAQPLLTGGDLIGQSIILPTVVEQRRIAFYLDAQTTKIDHLIALRHKQIDLLKEQRASLIQEAVTCGLNPNVPMKDSGIPWLREIPAHWEVKRNKVLFREIDKRSNDGSEELLTVSHITGVTPRAQKEDVNMFLAESNEGYKIVEVGDLAINTMWAWMGALGFSNYSGIVSPSYNVYRFRTAANVEYYNLLFRSPNFTKEIIRYSTGIWESRLRLYPQGFFEIRSPVPPIEEQADIVDFVEKETGKTEHVVSVLSRQIDLLQEYRAALIHECVTGQREIA